MIARIFREPLVHFLLIGGLIFAAFSFFDDSRTNPSTEQIIISKADLAAQSARFESMWKRKPQAQEVQSMTENLIRERVLVRAALELGMDRGDAVIERRLRQKMDFFAASIAEAAEPEEGELEAFFTANSEDYRLSPRYALSQIYLGENADAQTVYDALTALKIGTSPAELRQPSLLPEQFEMVPFQVLNNTFGTGFAESLAPLPLGEWAGPVRSGYGLHLVRISDKSTATMPTLDQVLETVLPDWKNAKRQEFLDHYYQSLRQGYEIILPPPDAAS